MNEPTIESLRHALREFALERDWDQFHSPKNLAMALSAEAGELLQELQWLSEDESHSPDACKRQAITEELADVFIYLVRIADKLDVDLLEAAFAKIVANAEKYPVSKARGSNLKYDEYD